MSEANQSYVHAKSTDAFCAIQQHPGYFSIPRENEDEPYSEENPEHVIIVCPNHGREEFDMDACHAAIADTFRMTSEHYAGLAEDLTQVYDFIHFGPLFETDPHSGESWVPPSGCSVIHAVNKGERRYHAESCQARECWGYEENFTATNSKTSNIKNTFVPDDQPDTGLSQIGGRWCNVEETKHRFLAKGWLEAERVTQSVQSGISEGSDHGQHYMSELEIRLNENCAEMYYDDDVFWQPDDTVYGRTSSKLSDDQSISAGSYLYHYQNVNVEIEVAGRERRRKARAYQTPDGARGQAASRGPLKQEVTFGTVCNRGHRSDQDHMEWRTVSTTRTERYHPRSDQDCLHRGFGTVGEAIHAEQSGRGTAVARLRDIVQARIMESLDHDIRAKDIGTITGALEAWERLEARGIADLFPGMTHKITEKIPCVYRVPEDRTLDDVTTTESESSCSA